MYSPQGQPEDYQAFWGKLDWVWLNPSYHVHEWLSPFGFDQV